MAELEHADPEARQAALDAFDAAQAARGMASTPEGRQAARQQLDDAYARMNPEQRIGLRARYGVQPAS